jgi:hypothetical protein
MRSLSERARIAIEKPLSALDTILEPAVGKRNKRQGADMSNRLGINIEKEIKQKEKKKETKRSPGAEKLAERGVIIKVY